MQFLKYVLGHNFPKNHFQKFSEGILESQEVVDDKNNWGAQSGLVPGRKTGPNTEKYIFCMKSKESKETMH